MSFKRQLPRKSVVLTFDDGYRCLQGVRLSRPQGAGLHRHPLRLHRLRGGGAQRAVVGGAQRARRRGLRRPGPLQDPRRPAHARPARPTRSSRAACRPSSSSRWPCSSSTSGRGRLSWPIPTGGRTTTSSRRRRSTATSPPSPCAAGQPGLRLAAPRASEPDLLRDDARGLHQEPQRLRGRGAQVRRPAAWAACLGLALAGGCATAAPERRGARRARGPARRRAVGRARAPTALRRASSSRPSTARRRERSSARATCAGRWTTGRSPSPSTRTTRRPGRAARSSRRRIEGAVAQRIQEGRAALHAVLPRRGAPPLPRRARPRPVNRTAFDALQNDVREVEFAHPHGARGRHARHARPALLRRPRRAARSSGRPTSSRRTRAWWRAPRSRSPRSPACPFVRAEPRREPLPPLAAPPAPGATPAPAPGPPPARPEPAREEPPEVNPLLADAREALERKEYAAALAGLDRLLASTPRTGRARTSRRSRSTSTARRSSTSGSTRSPTGR